ncbi:RNA polymerase recycling motor HelD [Paenibacillus sp. MMS20-IR301]|uniref:RNA polymerase recycling motor HelD n=1 Tax=Paenibacillus sp. MMS20-IR301 TaxID=2895946 RepID=UPI0028E66C3F|nr:RNA polymerase recycling motor HelD [Paenibacillus sp. MMS20-IR301]WNS45966.1 RNA polymerase recycling motor HelD [Paenibacillus sp. MMS20-IR301]
MKNLSDWQQEEQWLEQVKEKLHAEIAGLEPEVGQLKEQAADIRKRFWEEVTVNTSTDEDFQETFLTVNQQSMVLSERERRYARRLQQWRNMKRLLPSPYFGRIDFHEDGQSTAEQVYIGVSSFADTDGLNFIVYDWRTPIASLYYDYPPGSAAFETPGGLITGTMELKRQYLIRNGQLQHLFDSSVTIGDELLQQVLGKGADSQMKSIVATIQAEQNAIIRNDSSRMLIVQGAAGSGKTSAALQRVAYLLYKHRERLTADQIVLFSPNPMFNSYVSTVLPELGEENMQQATFQEYLETWLGDDFRLEDPFDQIEYVLTDLDGEGYAARMQAMEYKASETYLQALQGYSRWLGHEGMLFKDIIFRERVIISGEQMKSKLYSLDPSIRLANRIALVQKWLLEELGRLEKEEQGAAWVEEELNYLDSSQYAEVFRMLHSERGVFDFAEKFERIQEVMQNKRRKDESDFDYAEREEALLSQMVVKKQFRPLRRSVKQFLFADISGLYRQLFRDEQAYREMTGEAGVPEHWTEICDQTKAKLDRLELFYEDATPYLYLKELIEGTRTNTQVRHLFIDEGQDYSMFQYEFLRKLFPRARMTVLGDFGQAIFTQATNLSGSRSPLVQLYGEEETRQFQLVRSYRSTFEIVEFTKPLLPGGEAIIPFERRGRKPVLVKTQGDEQRAGRIAKDLAALKAEAYNSIAVITKTAAESVEAYEALEAAGVPGLRLVTKKTPNFEQGIQVIPAYLAKGVEFDAVLIYDAAPQTYQRESERKLFYTACTRAMHRLQLYTNGEWTPFVQAVDASLYELDEG